MADPRFHVPVLSPGVLRLPGPEGSHAGRSRRLSVGDYVVLFDGRGHEAAGRIVSAARSGVEVEIGSAVFRARPTPALTLAAALPKGPRQDLLVEKCTELGVAAIWPLLTERTIARGSGHKRDKWRRTTTEAAKQSGQCWLPELAEPRRLSEVVGDLGHFECGLAASGAGVGRSITDLAAELSKARSILAFVGPEGGWTDSEMGSLLAAGAQPVSLGPNILRIETAAVALVAVIHALAGGSG